MEKGEAVLPEQADAGQGGAAVDLQPVVPVVGDHVLVVVAAGRGGLIELHPGLPGVHGEALELGGAVGLKEQGLPGGAGGARHGGELVGVEAGHHLGHGVAEAHALHVHPALIDVIVPLHPL